MQIPDLSYDQMQRLEQRSAKLKITKEECAKLLLAQTLDGTDTRAQLADLGGFVQELSRRLADSQKAIGSLQIAIDDLSGDIPTPMAIAPTASIQRQLPDIDLSRNSMAAPPPARIRKPADDGSETSGSTGSGGSASSGSSGGASPSRAPNRRLPRRDDR